MEAEALHHTHTADNQPLRPDNNPLAFQASSKAVVTISLVF
jgi:hypothetical protein